MARSKKTNSSKVILLIGLPRYYNPDEAGRRESIERKKFDQTETELAQRFGGCLEHPAGKGFWWNLGVVWKDDIIPIEVDVPATKASRSWVRAYAKKTLLSRFQQDAIYIKWIRLVDVMEVRVTGENGP